MFRKLDTEKTGTIELNLVNVSSFSNIMLVVGFVWLVFVLCFFFSAEKGFNSKDYLAPFCLCTHIYAGFIKFMYL